MPTAKRRTIVLEKETFLTALLVRGMINSVNNLLDIFLPEIALQKAAVKAQSSVFLTQAKVKVKYKSQRAVKEKIQYI